MAVEIVDGLETVEVEQADGKGEFRCSVGRLQASRQAARRIKPPQMVRRGEAVNVGQAQILVRQTGVSACFAMSAFRDSIMSAKVR